MAALLFVTESSGGQIFKFYVLNPQCIIVWMECDLNVQVFNLFSYLVADGGHVLQI